MARNRTCNLPYEARMYQCAKIAEPIKGASMTGFISLYLLAESRQITMGNKSSPYFNNRVYIASMSYGGSDNMSLTCKIVDTSGNDFNVFLNALYKGTCDDNELPTALFEFGWIVTTVDGFTDIYSTANVDKSIYADTDLEAFRAPNGLLNAKLGELDIVSESAGCWVYNIKFTLLAAFENSQKIPRPIGTDEQKVPLREVGRKLFARACDEGRKAKDRGGVFFMRNEESHFSPYGFLNSEGGFYGPRSVWDATRKNPVAAMRNWMNSVTTDRKLGVSFYSDPAIMKPNIVAQEGWDKTCVENNSHICADAEQQPTIIYLVNAGDCTPVIDFKPNVQYHLSVGEVQGGGASAVSARTVQARSCGNRREDRKPKDRAGMQAQVMVPSSNLNFRSPDNALQSEAFALGANFAANTEVLQGKNITATLTIQGDVRWYAPNLNNNIVGIIYFNNPAVRSFTNKFEDVNCDWLAYPVVNNVFSGVSYLVTSVAHNIDESGVYTTELSLQEQLSKDQDGSKQPQ